MKSAKSCPLICLAIAAAALAGPVMARDGETAMPLGETVAAPAGFVALCEASPIDCSGAETSPQTLRAVETWAGRARWASVFAAAGIATIPAPAPVRGAAAAPAPAAIQPKPHLDPVAVRAAKDAARKTPVRPRKKAATPDAPTTDAPVTAPVETPPGPASPARGLPRPLDLQGVNSRINRAIRRSSDMDTFGAPDVWNAPSGPRARGDCEDYVLAKRRALIEAGVDPDLMSIALVRTRRGEAHAVLLVQTDDGEQVLDNLSPWVIRWDQAPYEWLERQAPGRPLVWVRPASAR